MRLFFALTLLSLLPLAGCDGVTSKVLEMTGESEPTIVIPPGYKITIDGKPVPIFGFDECPKSDSTMVKVFGESPTDGFHNCIVLTKDRAKVPVLVALSTGRVTEQWFVVRETGNTTEQPYSRTSLRRPDGALVVPVAMN
jgi:hypothetical protein